MKLKNSLRHMINNKVRVNGTTYQLNAKGVIDIDDKDAIATLLQDEAWSRVSTKRNPVGSVPTVKEGPNYVNMSKKDLINMCKYKKVNFKSSMAKEDLIKLLEENEVSDDR